MSTTKYLIFVLVDHPSCLPCLKKEHWGQTTVLAIISKTIAIREKLTGRSSAHLFWSYAH